MNNVNSYFSSSSTITAQQCECDIERIMDLESNKIKHCITKIANDLKVREFSEATNVCGMIIQSADVTWHNWLQGVDKSSWNQTEMIGILYGVTSN